MRWSVNVVPIYSYFQFFFFLTRTSWCGGENYQGHFLFTNSLWKIIGQQPTLLSIKLMKVGPPGLNTRFPAATVAIIHISGCDSLTYLLKVRVIWWLLIFLFDYQFLSECWSSGSYHLIIRSDSYDYSHLGMWHFLQSGNNRSSISLGPPLSRLDSIHTPHSHPSNVLWKLVSWVLSLDSSAATVTIIRILGCDSQLPTNLQTSSNLVIVNLPL